MTRRRILATILSILITFSIVFLMVEQKDPLALHPELWSVKRPSLKDLELPRLVMAFYHAWYGNTTGPSKKWFHWDHPIWDTATGETIGRHDPEKFIAPGFRDIGAAHYPLTGPYDCSDPELIRHQLDLAEEVGIDVFIIDWFGPPNGPVDNYTKVLIDYVEEHGRNIRFSILYDGYHYAKYPLSDSLNELRYLLNTYGERPSFLKVGNYSVIFVYASRYYTSRQWDYVIRTLRYEGFRAIFLADTFEEEYARVFDGLYTYSPLDVLLRRGNLTELYVKVRLLTSKYGGLFAGTATPGYDDRKIRKPGIFLDRRDGRVYNETWQAIIDSNPDWALICSWNEWHEGTEIEPSIQYGIQYLRLTKYFSDKFKAREQGDVESS